MKEQNETIKEKIRKAFSLSEDSASHEEIKERLLDGGKITGTNMCVLACAMVIASVGLNMSSTAVIIGAMLISPLMGSILASAYGSVSADYPLFTNHMVLDCRLQSVSLPLRFIFSSLQLRNQPLNCLQEHLLLFFDLLVAFFGGIAGIIGQTRIDKTNTVIPGVAIATALMPPLCFKGGHMWNFFYMGNYF